MLIPVELSDSPPRRPSSRERRGRKRKTSRSLSEFSRNSSSCDEDYHRSSRRKRKKNKLIGLLEECEDSERTKRKKGMPKRRKAKEEVDRFHKTSWRERRAEHHANEEGVSSRASAYGPPLKREGYCEAYDPPSKFQTEKIKIEEIPVVSESESEHIIDMDMSDEDDDEEFDFPYTHIDFQLSPVDDGPPPLEAMPPLPPPSEVFQKKKKRRVLPPPPILKRNRYDSLPKDSTYADVLDDEIFVAVDSPPPGTQEVYDVRDSPPPIQPFKVPPPRQVIINPQEQRNRLINGGVLQQLSPRGMETVNLGASCFDNRGYIVQPSVVHRVQNPTVHRVQLPPPVVHGVQPLAVHRVQPQLVHQPLPTPYPIPPAVRGGFAQRQGGPWAGAYPGMGGGNIIHGPAPPYNGSYRGSMRGNFHRGFSRGRGRGAFVNTGQEYSGPSAPPPQRRLTNSVWQGHGRQRPRPQPRVQDDVLECFSSENVKPLVKAKKGLLKKGMNEALLRNSLRSSTHEGIKPFPTAPAIPKWKQEMREKLAKLKGNRLNGEEEVVPLSSIIYEREVRPEEKASSLPNSREKERNSTVFCTNCGHQMKASNRFCTKCGTKRSPPAGSAGNPKDKDTTSKAKSAKKTSNSEPKSKQVVN